MLTLKNVMLTAALALCFGANATAQPLKTDLDKQSYSIGVSVGNYLSGQVFKQTELGAKVDMALVVRGFEDALKNKSQLSDDEVLKHLTARAEVLNQLHAAAQEKLRTQNRAKSTDYLTKNAKKTGVTQTASGLQYEILSAGKGVKPNTEDVVTVDYVGKLLDGTEFESTYKAKTPAKFVLMTVIPGLEEGIKQMKQGAKYRFTIPASLAYGKDGAGQIPPESALIFEVQLIKVDKVGADAKKAHGAMGGMGGAMGSMGTMSSPH